jgi:uncharacterized protein (TIGR03382 family)
MRIAFDPDGADLTAFNAHILVDIADPSGSAGKNCTVGSSPTDVTCSASGSSTWSATFTMPNTPCSNCTLQVIQDMSGDTTDAVTDPTGDATYFQCADIILTGAGGEGEGEGEGAAGEGEGEAGEGEGDDGEGEAGEGEAGEGEGAVGEGEGAVGEGEGAVGEGEGAVGEGEGAVGEGEGEGEGEKKVGLASCSAAGDASATMALMLGALALVRRRRATR